MEKAKQLLEEDGYTLGADGIYEKDGEKLLILGDLIHFPSIQLPNPDVAVVYDVDPVKAVETRKRVFDFVSANNFPVAGMHVPFPGKLEIQKTATGYAEK